MAIISLGEAITEVSVRLGDENNVFWTTAELYAYFCEALQCLNAFTGYWKTQFDLTLTPPFYSNWFAANGVGSPRQQTLTDTNIYNLIEYHLLEPATGAMWTGTDQFSIQDLWQACSRRRNEMLQLAACNMQELTLNCIPNANTVPVPDSALDIRRVRWLGVLASPTGVADSGSNNLRVNSLQGLAVGQVVVVPGIVGAGTTVLALGGDTVTMSQPAITNDSGPVNFCGPVTLQRGDALSFQRFAPAYLQTNANPLRWDVLNGLQAWIDSGASGSGKLLSLELDTLVNVPSTVQALTIAGASDFDPPGGNPLLIPNDWAWVLKFGALADILMMEEEGRDVQRAQYCRQRYEQGLQLMMAMPWLTQGLINGVAVDTQALAAADRTNYEWQSRQSAFPEIVIGGIDLFSVSPFPSQQTSVGMLVVQNAPIPPNTPSAAVYLPRDAVEAVIKETQHLALLKMGGAEFAESMALHNEFLAFCKQTNARLLELGIFPTDYAAVMPKQDSQQPRFIMGKE